MGWRKEGDMIIIRMERGDDFFERLREIHSHVNLSGYVVVSGLGQMYDVELAFYDWKKGYEYKQFKGVFELISMAGDFAELDGELIPHIHVVLSDNEMRVFGGHLSRAKVGATLELFLQKAANELKRKKVNGLSVIDV